MSESTSYVAQGLKIFDKNSDDVTHHALHERDESGYVIEGGARLEEIKERLENNEEQRKKLLQELKLIEGDARRWMNEAGKLLERYGEKQA